ncbi:hypothetical protein [Parabacteroides goldsteinii]|jgi:hypothetical protein|uniref:hypothetical protein n=1 Tax=Parabacteroides goldsteinii TaxID=328812 RepID=UPI00256ED609|nr:hypothetical protein [Parabacteroides goldsteinii]
MEIKNTNQNGVSKVNSLLRIKYAISIKEDEVRSFTGQIMNEDVCVGFCNASNTGVIGFSLSEDNGLTDEEIKAVACKFIEDVTESFGKAANPKTDPVHTDSQEQS